MTISLTTILTTVIGIIVTAIGWAVKQILGRQTAIGADVAEIRVEVAEVKAQVAVQTQRLHGHLQTEEVAAAQTDKRISDIQHGMETQRRETREDMAAIYGRLNELGRRDGT